jgi:hypothetical protein
MVISSGVTAAGFRIGGGNVEAGEADTVGTTMRKKTRQRTKSVRLPMLRKGKGWELCRSCK